jgi:hypothetical protein
MIVLIILLYLNPEFEHLFVILLLCSCLPEKTRVHWQSHLNSIANWEMWTKTLSLEPFVIACETILELIRSHT